MTAPQPHDDPGRERAARAAEELARRPPATGWRRRHVDRLAGAAEVLARQLQQRATRGRGRAR
jgi:hypothetical protein